MTVPTGASSSHPLQPTSPEERTWTWVSHAGCFVGAAVAMAFIVPLAIMLTKGQESPFVRRHAVESLNFQITALIYAVASAVLVLVVIGLVAFTVISQRRATLVVTNRDGELLRG